MRLIAGTGTIERMTLWIAALTLANLIFIAITVFR